MSSGGDVPQWPVLCLFRCHTYQLTKQVQTGKENRKKSVREPRNYCLTCALIVLQFSHWISERQCNEVIATTMYEVIVQISCN